MFTSLYKMSTFSLASFPFSNAVDFAKLFQMNFCFDKITRNKVNDCLRVAEGVIYDV